MNDQITEEIKSHPRPNKLSKPAPHTTTSNTSNTSLSLYHGPAFTTRPLHFKSLSLFFSSSSITTHFGRSSQPAETLHFTFFLAEDPMLAIYSTISNPLIPAKTRAKFAARRHRPSTALSRMWAWVVARCDAEIRVETVEGTFEYGVRKGLVRWWDREEGVVLVEWRGVYTECFEEERWRGEKEEVREREVEWCKVRGRDTRGYIIM